MKRILAIIVAISLLAGQAFGMGYEEERKLSTEVIGILEAQGAIIHDDEITWVLQSLADQLADHIKDPKYTIHTYLVADTSVNAFAITDGNIFINIGTLLFVKDLDELAAVMAHEMGHCQLRHIPQAMDAQKTITIASLAGVIAGLLLAAGNPNAGMAVVTSSLGGAENLKLQYTRKQETEADEFARNIMPLSGYDTAAMARFLIRMNTYVDTSSSVPIYMLTHPYTKDRIAAVEKTPTDPHPNANFWAMQTAVLGDLLPEAEVYKRSAGLPEQYRQLARGIAKIRAGKDKDGLALLEGINLPQAQSWKGLALYHLGQKDKALPYLLANHRNADVCLALSEVLAARGQVDDAIALIKPYQEQSPRVAHILGTLYEKQGKAGLAHAAYAHYFFVTQNYKACQYHITKALAEKDLSSDEADALKQMKDAIAKLLRERSGNG